MTINLRHCEKIKDNVKQTNIVAPIIIKKNQHIRYMTLVVYLNSMQKKLYKNKINLIFFIKKYN